MITNVYKINNLYNKFTNLYKIDYKLIQEYKRQQD